MSSFTQSSHFIPNFVPLPIKIPYSKFSSAHKGLGITYLHHLRRLLFPSVLFYPFPGFTMFLYRTNFLYCLRFGQNHLPAHLFYLFLNDSLYCTRYQGLIKYNVFYLLFDFPDILHSHRLLSTIYITNNVPFTLPYIF
jgi:hypothetical protein